MDIDAVLEKCKDLRRNSQFVEAINLLDDAMRHTADARLYYSRGISFDLMDDRVKAIEDLTSAIMLDPLNPKYFHERGSILSILDRDDEAIQDFRQVLAMNPDNVEGHRQCCLSLLIMGKPNRALNHAEAALKLAPENANTHFCLGECYMSLQRFEEAEASFRKALQLDSSQEHYSTALSRSIEERLNSDF